jgi:hypothetical protein
MAKNKKDILTSIGLSEESSLDELISKLATYSVVQPNELIALKSTSVHTLPTVVKNDEKAVKEKMYGLVANEDKGAVALMNKRSVLFEAIIKKLGEQYVDWEQFNNFYDEYSAFVLETNNNIRNLENTKADASNVDITFSQIFGELSLKADVEHVDNELSKKADITFVNKKIADLVDGAPDTLDTLKEVADALKENDDVVDVLNKSISQKADKEYVNNEFALKKNIPTKTSQLTNDSKFITSTVENLTNYYLKSQTYSKNEVLELVGKLGGLSIEAVDTLPTSEIIPNTLYLVKCETEENQNIYEEYIYINDKWELIGTTKIDLSNYVQKDEVMPIVEENSDEVDTLELEEVDTLTVGKSDNYNVESDDQVPTTKAVKQIVDEKIANLVNSAPETLDTLGEVAQALQENDDVVEALNNAIGNKADKKDLDNAIATAITNVLNTEV